MLAQDRDIFDIPLEARQSHSTGTLNAWYTYAKPLVDYSVKQAQDFGPGFRPITDYFPAVIPAELFDIILGRPGPGPPPPSLLTIYYSPFSHLRMARLPRIGPAVVPSWSVARVRTREHSSMSTAL
jgi:hypothetical protein